MSRDDELGGLWLKTSERTGKKFMTGRLTLNGEAVEMSANIRERFEKKIAYEPSCGCWLWTGAGDKYGYGRIGLGPKRSGIVATHRLSWLLHKGEVPAGMRVLHRCDTPACVNPDHLFLGTAKDNTHDMMRKGRHGFSFDMPQRKLTVDDVRDIMKRELSASGYAKKYGVSRGLIGRIWTRRSGMAFHRGEKHAVA